MRELVVTPSFSSGANSQLYLASFSLRPNDLRKYIYGGLDYPICFESKCFDEKFRAELANHAEVLVDRLIEKKSKLFNELHKTNFSVRYWRILLGPWVHQFVHQTILFDRILQFAIGRIGSETVLVQAISRAQWPQFQTTLDAITASKHDFFIQVLFSFIVKSRYRDKFVHRDVSFDSSSDDSSKIARESFITFSRVILSKFILFISSKIREDLLLASEVPENKKIDFKLWWASNFRWVPDFITDRSYMGFKATTPRFFGEEITQTYDDFDLIDVAFDHFVPSVFVEHYDSFRSFAIGSVPMPAMRGVIGSTSWYYRERFKFIAAEVCESGGRSIGVQHGGNYGLQKNHPILRREVLDRDVYITWGWTVVSALNGLRAEIMALPSLKLCGTRPRTKAHNSGNKILFAGSEMPRFPRWIGKDDFEIFRTRLMSQNQFFETLRIEFRMSCVFRGNPRQFGWGQIDELNERFPELTIDDHQYDFQAALDSTDVFCTNNLSTTYAEALYRNIPTVLFWRDSEITIEDDAADAFQLLRDAGVLLNDGREAGTFLNSSMDNIAAWWWSDSIQDARRTFCARYLQASNTAVSDWLKTVQS
tara:strand:- start:1325 stop:3103 length:1779 start_codon:yes stop_codon:yes gene_type:complete